MVTLSVDHFVTSCRCPSTGMRDAAVCLLLWSALPRKSATAEYCFFWFCFCFLNCKQATMYTAGYYNWGRVGLSLYIARQKHKKERSGYVSSFLPSHFSLCFLKSTLALIEVPKVVQEDSITILHLQELKDAHGTGWNAKLDLQNTEESWGQAVP